VLAPSYLLPNKIDDKIIRKRFKNTEKIVNQLLKNKEKNRI
jgi:hypothetical protein